MFLLPFILMGGSTVAILQLVLWKYALTHSFIKLDVLSSTYSSFSIWFYSMLWSLLSLFFVFDVIWPLILWAKASKFFVLVWITVMLFRVVKTRYKRPWICYKISNFEIIHNILQLFVFTHIKCHIYIKLPFVSNLMKVKF